MTYGVSCAEDLCPRSEHSNSWKLIYVASTSRHLIILLSFSEQLATEQLATEQLSMVYKTRTKSSTPGCNKFS